jgi:pyruvate dehydrogenase E1 component alpha subunit
MERRLSEQFAGNPRDPVQVPLANARQLGIRQVLDQRGNLTGDLPDPGLSQARVIEIYDAMALLRRIDERGWTLQRSGRIAFWIPNRGQEAPQVGATMAIASEDWIFRAHRELAPWIIRGNPLHLLFSQFFGTEEDILKGRRLPCLVGSRRINLVASPTQVGVWLPHAVGVAWAAKLKKSPVAVLAFLGDGATSRGEFHSALNFAGIHTPPVIFLCINNGWAVSTPLDRQSAVTDFASKANAYGVRNVRVDGNDPLAIYAVVKEARETLHKQGPILIEAVTYRLGYHTSSDNPDLYRHEAECASWLGWDPIGRLKSYMETRGWWSSSDEEAMIARHARDLQAAVETAGAAALPGAESQFEDVFAESNWMLREQKQRILAELQAAGDTDG